MAREICMLSLAEVLVPEEQDLELDEGGLEFSQDRRIRRFREIDAPDFGPEARALERCLEMIEVERIESLALTRNMSAWTIMQSALDLHSGASMIGPQRTADGQ